MAKLTDEHKAHALKLHSSGVPQTRIAGHLQAKFGVKVTQQAVSKALAGAKAEKQAAAPRPEAPTKKAADVTDPLTEIRRLRARVRRIGKYATGPLKLRALEVELKIAERLFSVIEAQSAGDVFADNLCDFIAQTEQRDGELRGRAPREWIEQSVRWFTDSLCALAYEVEHEDPTWVRTAFAFRTPEMQAGDTLADSIGRLHRALTASAPLHKRTRNDDED